MPNTQEGQILSSAGLEEQGKLLIALKLDGGEWKTFATSDYVVRLFSVLRLQENWYCDLIRSFTARDGSLYYSEFLEDLFHILDLITGAKTVGKFPGLAQFEKMATSLREWCIANQVEIPKPQLDTRPRLF